MSCTHEESSQQRGSNDDQVPIRTQESVNVQCMSKIDWKKKLQHKNMTHTVDNKLKQYFVSYSKIWIAKKTVHTSKIPSS